MKVTVRHSIRLAAYVGIPWSRVCGGGGHPRPPGRCNCSGPMEVRRSPPDEASGAPTGGALRAGRGPFDHEVASPTFMPAGSPIMKSPRTPGTVGAKEYAATRLQTILPARPGSHAGAGREVRLGGSAHAGFRISCHRRERAARLSAGVD